MPVTHSPGNPFAFSTARSRTAFQHRKSTDSNSCNLEAGSPFGNAQNSAVDDLRRSEYSLRECKEDLLREHVFKDAKIDDLERRLLDEGKKTDRAETDKRFLFDLQARQAEEITALKSDMAKVRSATDVALREHRISNNDLREKLGSCEDRNRAELQSQERELGKLRASLASQQRAMDTLKDDLSAKNEILSDKNMLISDLEERYNKQSISKKAHDPQDIAFLTKELANALQNIKSLEIASASQVAKNRQQQDIIAKLSVVNEEKQALMLRVEMMDAMREDLAHAQVQLVKLERQRVSYEALFDDTNGQDAAVHVAKQKIDLESAVSELAVTQEQLSRSNDLLSSVEDDLRAVRKDLEHHKFLLTHEKQSVQRLQRRESLMTRETSFLREQLRSYDLEEQMESPNFDRLKNDRILELETVVDEYRSQLATTTTLDSSQLKPDLKRRREDDSNFNDIERGEYLRKIRSLTAELEIAKRENVLLHKELTALNMIKLAASDDTTSQSSNRVLQHRANPTSIYQAVRTQMLKDLRQENESLLAELTGKGAVSVPIQTLRNAETESRKLEELVKHKEKMNLRLKEVFAAKSSEFREAVYSLLGYKLDFLQNGRVRLTSMYAGKAEYAFLFDGEAGTMKLCGDVSGDNTFMESIGNLIKYWSGEKNSIPGMLSALTLELLEKAA